MLNVIWMVLIFVGTLAAVGQDLFDLSTNRYQNGKEMRQTIREVKTLGLLPRLAEYSPLPNTALWDEACRVSRFPLAEEPLFHNNSLWPCLNPFSWETVQALKDWALV